MRDVPAWVESLRAVILLVVWAVLVLRVPAVWRKRQRPVWIVLLALVAGSIAIQEPVGNWIDDTTGVAKASELVVVFAATADFAVLWWFAITLHAAGHATPAWLRRAPLVCAATMAALAVFFFAVTPEADRFGAQAQGWWLGYAACWILYGLVTAVGAGAIFWRHGLSMRSPVLRISVLALAVGTTAEVPYLIIRAIRWVVADAPSWLQLTGFWCSFGRFVLVALGCSLAALAPLLRAALCWYRRQRLHGIWQLLRAATPELVVGRQHTRGADLLSLDNAWEQLHQRVIEVRDAVQCLHDGRTSPELLRQATEFAEERESGERARLLATACWIEVTRRDGLADLPKRHADVDRTLLPEVHAGESTVQREIDQLLRLHRELRSPRVHEFADRVRDETAAV